MRAHWIAGLLMVGWLLSAPALAGPPFLTDDPEPVPYRHFEFYVFSTLDDTAGANTALGPAVEYNFCAAPELQLHLVVPLAYFSPASGTRAYGLGDVELGLKYRFVDETSDHPQIGIFPMIELPTGSAARGLGNGQAWYRLPVWVQKSWGPWTMDGGGGYVINRASGMRNYFFAGWLLQRVVSPSLTLGGEIFSQGADNDTDRGSTLANFGGYWNWTPDFSLLFSAGHSVGGLVQQVTYVGLYWTWGPPPGSA